MMKTKKQSKSNLHPVFEDIFEQLAIITRPTMIEKAMRQDEKGTNKVIEKLLK
jgi:hypothetical protein